MSSRSNALLAKGALLVLMGSSLPAVAGGGTSALDPPWNPEHFNALPPEVKRAIAPHCRSMPHLAHYFATYSAQSRVLNLHFEYFHCEGASRFCGPAGCLHQVYVLTNGQYRLLRSFYRADPD